MEVVNGPRTDLSPSAGPPRSRSTAIWLGPWIPVAAGLLCFAGTLGHGFTYDDKPIIVRNPRIRDLTDFRGIWLTDWWARQTDDANEVPDPNRDRLYRPLTLLSFALNYRLGGVAPSGYHAVNVALHGLVCWLVW